MPKKSRSRSRSRSSRSSFPSLNNTCMPAYLYFYISLLVLIVIAIQNIGNKHSYCVGPYDCDVPDTMLVFIVKLLYIIFWTWLLHVICKAGYTKIAWFIFLLPIILMFLAILILLFN